MPQDVSRRVVVVCALGVVAFAFWHALFGGGSLVSADLVATAPPFDAHRPADFSLENGPGDTIGIHSHWASLAGDVRSSEVGWWTPDLAGGQPTLKGGVPIFALPYLAVPDWYAPGLVAAIRTLVAIGLTLGYLRAIGTARSAALVGALAFGLSGFMVGWMNWPQSSVAAFAPGLLWAFEGIIRSPRLWRAAPLGVMGALMVWASFPAVLIYLIAATALYAAIRLASIPAEQRQGLARIGGVVVMAAVVAALLAAPFLDGFAEYLDWGDTTYRTGNPDDSSAGVGYLLTSVAPAIWGSDAVGAPWFGEGNWVEYNAYAGASVAFLAVIGIVSGVRSSDRRRQSVAAGLAGFAVLGVLVAYVGGPLGVALGAATGPLGGLMTRAKVLWSLGIALGAALGVDRLMGADDRRSLRVDLRNAAGVAVVALVLLAPSIRNWYDAASAQGVVRETLAVSTMPLLALVAAIGVAVARWRGRCSGPMAGGILVVIVAVELLAFAMPVPTTVTRSERLTSTPAHDVAAAALTPGERLGGEGRTFFATTAQLFDLPDVRGHLLKSTGYQALLREVDPDMLTRNGGGTATNPNIAIGTDPRSPVWRAMGLGAWAQFPDSVPIGTLLDSPPPTSFADPAVQPLSASTVVPAGGLRAVVFEVDVAAPGFVIVEISTLDGTVTEERWVDVGEEQLAWPLLGEHLAVGSPVDVVIAAPASTLRVGVDGSGAVPVARVAGDDDLELVRVGDVVLFDVPSLPAYVIAGAAVEADPTDAAALVATGATVIDRDLGLPPSSGTEVAYAATMESGRDEVRIFTDSPEGGLLVVSVNNYPGWRAEVDGQAAEIATANAAFMGVVVPPGEHEVVLHFRPNRLGLRLLSLLLGTVAAAVLLVEPARRCRRGRRVADPA